MESRLARAKSNENKQTSEDLIRSFQDRVQQAIGEEWWTVAFVNPGYKSVTITFELSGNQTPGAKRIGIRCAKKIGRFQGEEFTTNIPTMGSFGLLDGNSELRFYQAVGKLISDEHFLTVLRQWMNNFIDELEKLDTDSENS